MESVTKPKFTYNSDIEGTTDIRIKVSDLDLLDKNDRGPVSFIPQYISSRRRQTESDVFRFETKNKSEKEFAYCVRP